jgi:hypothetical protein
MQSLLKDINKSIIDDINLNNKNKANNNKDSVPLPVEGAKQEISFANGEEMISYALDKYNKANNIYTTGTGTFYITASPLGIPIKAPLSMTFIKAKSGVERYFTFRLLGKLNDSLPEAFRTLDLSSEHYTDGILYSYNLYSKGASTTGWQNVTFSDYQKIFGWNMQDIFMNLAKENLIEETKPFYFDEGLKQYIVGYSLNSVAAASYSKTISTIANSSSPNFKNIEIEIRVDKYGNFKQISYSEELSLNLNIKDLGSVSATAKTGYVEKFVVINDGDVKINKPVIE